MNKLPFRFHYAYLILFITFFVMLAAASVRSAPQVFIRPFESEFKWDRASISFAVAISLFAFGFGGPIGGSLVDRFGPRRVMLGGLSLVALGLILLLGLTQLWQLHLLWGLVIGVGTGAVSNVLGATVVDRWFVKYRGIAVGVVGAAAATGQLIFLPLMVQLAKDQGWRSAMITLIVSVSVMVLPVLLLMRDRPSEVQTTRIGEETATAASRRVDSLRTPLRDAIRTRDFWFLAGSFFVCGYTTNGLIGTHLLPHTLEHGFTEIESAGAIGLMGAMNIFGTLASGWLSDRYDNRKLLALYYGFRAISLLALPFVIELRGLLIFSILYGLDWIATVPPTVNLTAQRFGRASLGTIYGWIFCSHMIGAGIAAYAGGFFHDILGDYHLIFISAAILGVIASGLSMQIRVKTTPQPV
jgi:sugar phosphate permease